MDRVVASLERKTHGFEERVAELHSSPTHHSLTLGLTAPQSKARRKTRGSGLQETDGHTRFWFLGQHMTPLTGP